VSLCTKFAAVARLTDWQFLRAAEKWVKFLMLQEGTIKEGQNLDPKKYE
jgi:hypothetical protein